MPSTDSSKVRHCPVGESIFAFSKPMYIWGCVIMVTPPASAESHCLLSSASQAASIATSDEEHAVSTLFEGPSQFHVKETWPGMNARMLPVMKYDPISLDAFSR